jgi:hypothetical protein
MFFTLEFSSLRIRPHLGCPPPHQYAFFIERCRRNLHVVLCLSPIGDALRTRLRMFPSLVNCTTIDWFHPWPRDALQNVALRSLSEIQVRAHSHLSVLIMLINTVFQVIADNHSFPRSKSRSIPWNCVFKKTNHHQ